MEAVVLLISQHAYCLLSGLKLSVAKALPDNSSAIVGYQYSSGVPWGGVRLAYAADRGLGTKEVYHS